MKGLDLLFLILLLIVLFCLVYTITRLRTDGARCVINTPLYLIKAFEKSNGVNVSCKCFAEGRGEVTFGKGGIIPVEDEFHRNYIPFNFSQYHFFK